jgi:hypothetical protein
VRRLLPWISGASGRPWRRRFSVALASWSVPDPQVLGVVRAEQGRSLGLDSFPLPCRQGVGQAEIGRLWPISLPLALGIVEGGDCPWPSQAAKSDDSKLRARRSYQQLSELLCARLRSSSFFLAAKMPKRKIFSSCYDASPSGSSPAPASSLWRSKSTVISVRSGADREGPDGFFQKNSRILSVMFQSLSRIPLVVGGLDETCIHRLVIICSF